MDGVVWTVTVGMDKVERFSTEPLRLVDLESYFRAHVE
jgi:hypothetical protein